LDYRSQLRPLAPEGARGTLGPAMTRIASESGPLEKARERHVARGKLLPRDRVMRLIDPGSPFLELSPLAANGMYGEAIHGAGLITGIGRIEGRECVIVCNDSTIKGGTYYPMTVKKHLRAQEIARENRLPCIYLVDSGGANLPHQTEVFPDREHFGRIFYNQARLSAPAFRRSRGHGLLHRGRRLCAGDVGRDDHRARAGHDLLGGPPLVKAATGEVVSSARISAAPTCTRASRASPTTMPSTTSMRSTSCAASSRTSTSRSASISKLTSRASRNTTRPSSTASCRPTCASNMTRARSSRGSSMARSSTSSSALYGTTLVTGFARLLRHAGRHPRQQRHSLSESAQKAAHFIELCCQRRIPLLFLQNISGFMVGKDYEAGGIAKDGAKMVTAVACAQVPKITLIVGGSFGAGNYGMCGRAYSPRFLFTWPNARISVMGGEQAASVLATVKRENIEAGGGQWSQVEEEAFKAADPRAIRGGGQSLLRHRAALGRRDHYAVGDAAGFVAGVKSRR
jgi:3-methylcrotonyl-CoA carboxylase beta subunit